MVASIRVFRIQEKSLSNDQCLNKTICDVDGLVTFSHLWKGSTAFIGSPQSRQRNRLLVSIIVTDSTMASQAHVPRTLEFLVCTFVALPRQDCSSQFSLHKRPRRLSCLPALTWSDAAEKELNKYQGSSFLAISSPASIDRTRLKEEKLLRQ